MAIVTISRQVGSYGDEIAKLVAQKLGYELIGREIIRQRAQECDAEFKQACAAYESETSPRGFFERMFLGDPGYTALFEFLTYELASRGDVVLVGRGAHLVLAEVPGVLKCAVAAPEPVRVARVAEEQGLSRERAETFVARYGKRRTALLESVYHKKLNDWNQYDLIINTAVLSAEAAAELIVQAAKEIGTLADREQRSRILTDLVLAKRIERAIKGEITTMTYRDVLVRIEDGTAVLDGLLSDERDKQKAERIARDFEGVTKVVNNIRVAELRA